MELRDQSQAYANGRFDIAVKSLLKNSGSCGSFYYPACTAPAWLASGSYPRGSKITYDGQRDVHGSGRVLWRLTCNVTVGYLWQARYFGTGAPYADDTGSWVPSTF